GLPVDAVSPEAAIYLTIKIDAVGKTTADGSLIKTQAEVTTYILQEAKLAIVPFYAFGASKDSAWYRLSVGTCKKDEIEEMISKLRKALQGLQ
ncbi:MAG TPA: aminotransferase class I/II-fold pyridoxal phosphate-dependent enzyme, partial [Chitinophagaceae bacterium]|nr:aminotransferase class I/II-fold pyridoxal phosphate-dependent enzyme [Chitinophagaceae bacterium]